MDQELAKVIATELGKFQLQIIEEGDDPNELSAKLAAAINHLITSDFPRLIFILYRLDISENKLKELLSNSSQLSAGGVIANLIIERQLQKITARQQFKQDSQQISDDERW